MCVLETARLVKQLYGGALENSCSISCSNNFETFLGKHQKEFGFSKAELS